MTLESGSLRTQWQRVHDAPEHRCGKSCRYVPRADVRVHRNAPLVQSKRRERKREEEIDAD